MVTLGGFTFIPTSIMLGGDSHNLSIARRTLLTSLVYGSGFVVMTAPFYPFVFPTLRTLGSLSNGSLKILKF
jgi:hypothetical protein